MRKVYVVCSNVPGGPDAPAEFVEVETQDGKGIGGDGGLAWEPYGPLARLGPFVLLQEVEELVTRTRKLADLVLEHPSLVFYVGTDEDCPHGKKPGEPCDVCMLAATDGGGVRVYATETKTILGMLEKAGQ